jgi:Sulfatase
LREFGYQVMEGVMRQDAASGWLAALVLASLTTFSAHGQQVTGTPGSSGSTTTIDGRYLPNPMQPFRGEIAPNATESKPYWPALVMPPKGAPNILLIVTDDVGFAAPSTFGGVIPTPALDRIAQTGLRYTRFHTTALCSPTRAALLTGRKSFGGQRRRRRSGDRLPRLRQHRPA